MFVLGTVFDTLFSIPTVIFVIGGTVAMVAIIAGVVGKVVTVRARERTRREIAAYVAEGTIDPDKAIEMLKAGRSSDCQIKL